jgi:uncharacterized iron-regulated membrane protein
MSVIDPFTAKENPIVHRPVASTKRLEWLQKITLRKILLKLHLYISLWLGLFLAIAGLTGSILVYGEEIDHWLNSDILAVEVGSSLQPLQNILATADQVSPIKHPAHHIQLPKHPDEALIVRYQVPHDGPGHNHHFHEVMVNPYNGQTLGHRDRNDSLINFILRLHYKLLVDPFGKWLMGITALLTLVLTITGIYLWWPKTGKWLQALVIKRNASFTRFNFDLHKTVGIYTAVVLFAVSLSGFYFNFPDVFKPAVNVFSSVHEVPRAVKSKTIGTEALAYETILSNAQLRFPNLQLQRLFLPVDANGSFMVSGKQPNETRSKGATMLWLDQYSGEILTVRDPNQFAAGDAFINIQLPLHNGEILGTPGQITVLIVGFAPLALLITGIIHWLKKRASRRIHNQRLTAKTQ